MHSVGSTLSLAGNKRVTNQILSLSHLPDPGRKECSFVTSSSFLILENMFQSSLYDKLVNILSKEAIGTFTRRPHWGEGGESAKNQTMVLICCVNMTWTGRSCPKIPIANKFLYFLDIIFEWSPNIYQLHTFLQVSWVCDILKKFLPALPASCLW